MTPIRPVRTLSLSIALALSAYGIALSAQEDARTQNEMQRATQQNQPYQQGQDNRWSKDEQLTQQQRMERAHGQDAAHKADHSGQYTSQSGKPEDMLEDRSIVDRPGQTASDARREGVIWTAFALSRNLRDTDLKIEVRQGEAILTGRVESRAERELAEEIAQAVSGISRVNNRVTIDANVASRSDRSIPGSMNRTGAERDFATVVSDAATTASVKSKLLWNRDTDGLDINVNTENGKVTLLGAADTEASKRMAERLARDTTGVLSVENQLRVDPQASVAARGDDADRNIQNPTRSFESTGGGDAAISSNVRTSLLGSTAVDSQRIQVSAENGVVRLTGSVPSNRQKQLAVQLARNVDGVNQVDAGNLQVSAEGLADSEDDNGE